MTDDLYSPEEETPAQPNKITHIQYDNKRPGLAHVHINGKKTFSMPAFDAGLLECGSEMASEEIKKRSLSDEKQRCWANTLRLLGVRSQSRSELRKKLKAKEYGSESIRIALSRAEEAGYIDDEAFAKQWVDSRMRNQPKGRYMLRQELKMKGIDDGIIERLLSEELDETKAALTLLSKRAWKWKKLDPFAFKQKAYAYLAGKGFPFEVTSEAVDRYLEQENSGN